MDLHRPKDINSLNDDFFKDTYSGEPEQSSTVLTEEKNEPTENDNLIQGEIDAIIVESEADIKSGYVARQLKQLAETEFTNNDQIFHDFSQETDDDESALYEAFPEIDFDPSIFSEDEEEQERKEAKKEAVKKAKEEAKSVVENEKKRIKEQKALEQEVQKPFSRKRNTVIFTTIFFIIGVLAASVCGILHSISTHAGSLTVSSLTLYYADSAKIDTQQYKGKVIAATNGSIQGSQDVLFRKEDGTRSIGKIIAIGDGIYGIDMGDKVHRVNKEDIIGIVKFATPNIAKFYLITAKLPEICFVTIGIYLALVVFLAVLRIRKANLEIEELEENYEII